MPEVTKDYIRIPVRSRSDGDQIRTISISSSQGISALYNTTTKRIITYLFRRDKGWTMNKGRAWISEHKRR